MAHQVLIITVDIDHGGIMSIVEQAIASRAAILSLKVTDESQLDLFHRLSEEIKLKTNGQLLVQLNFKADTPEKLIEVVEKAAPQSVLIPLTKLIPAEDYQIEAEEFLTALKENKVVTQYEINNTDEFLYFADLCDQRIIPEGDDFILLNFSEATLEKLTKFIKTKEDKKLSITWVITTGLNTEKAAQHALLKGGGVAIKFEEFAELLAKIL